MFSIGAAAYNLYSATSRVGSTLSTISDLSKWISDSVFSSPNEMSSLHPQVRTRFEWLVRRIAVISQPLNYCLLWSQYKSSSVDESIHQSKEVLKQIYSFLSNCNKNKKLLADKEYMLNKLNEHIHEIDFCLNSLNLSLSIIQNTQQYTPNRNSSVSTISSSTLLKASERIRVHHNLEGDVAICFGKFYIRIFDSNNTHKGWALLYNRCSLTVYRNKGIKYDMRITDEGNTSSTNQKQYLFPLNTSLYFTTISSVLLNLEINGIKDDIVSENMFDDSFIFTEMRLNQIYAQYCFIFKSGLDNWDIPLLNNNESENSNEIIDQDDDILSDNSSDEKYSQENNIQKSVSEVDTNSPYTNTSSSFTSLKKRVKPYMSSSMISLDNHVTNTHKTANVKKILISGGDFDDNYLSPLQMAYIVRLAIYENDNSRPTLKKYKSQNNQNNSIQEENTKNQQKLIKELEEEPQFINNDDIEDEPDMDKLEITEENKDIDIKKEEPEILTATSEEIGSDDDDTISKNDMSRSSLTDINVHNRNTLKESDIGYSNIYPNLGPNSKHFLKPMNHLTPSHLNATDEELEILLTNPLPPYIPYYTSSNNNNNNNSHNNIPKSTNIVNMTQGYNIKMSTAPINVTQLPHFTEPNIDDITKNDKIQKNKKNEKITKNDKNIQKFIPKIQINEEKGNEYTIKPQITPIKQSQQQKSPQPSSPVKKTRKRKKHHKKNNKIQHDVPNTPKQKPHQITSDTTVSMNDEMLIHDTNDNLSDNKINLIQEATSTNLIKIPLNTKSQKKWSNLSVDTSLLDDEIN